MPRPWLGGGIAISAIASLGWSVVGIDESADQLRIAKDRVGHLVEQLVQANAASMLGAAYDVPLLDTSYDRDLLPGLEAGLYGSSFRFEVRGGGFDQRASRSEHNPQGLPERVITDALVHEFGPVTWPQYGEATAGLRALWTPARRQWALVLLRSPIDRRPSGGSLANGLNRCCKWFVPLDGGTFVL